MARTVIIAALFLVVLLLTGLLLLGKAPAGETYIIEMASGGFSPSELAIQRGDTIVWQNIDEEFRWPASNIHPTHEIYPEFDPDDPIGPGTSWRFTFRRSGEWQFHDHLQPRYIGVITVVD